MIEFARNDLGIELHPYQSWLYIHALELLPSGDFRFDTIVVLIARQNGKTTWWKILILYVMYVLGMKLVLSTAQDLDTAEETWDAVVEMVTGQDDNDQYLRPELAEMVDKITLVNGKKTLKLKTGERYKAKAASRRAGRGLAGDLIGLDELREHQNWDSWSAITHTTMARARSLIIGLSNAGDATSVVLRYLRRAGHAALGDPDGINAGADNLDVAQADDDLENFDDVEESLGLFEWSAPPDADIRDRDGWAAANPSLGHPNGVSERKILAATREPEWVFRTEVLCQWSDGSLSGPFPAGCWAAGVDENSQIVGQVVACIDVATNQTRAHIAFAGYRADGLPHVELVASRAGVEWVAEWLQHPHRAGLIDAVTAQSKGAPVSPLLDDWRDAGLTLVDWTGPELTAATSNFYLLVRDSLPDKLTDPPAGVRHLPQPALDVAAAAAATKPAGDGLWFWDRKRSAVDIAPLVAATGAVWLLTRPIDGPIESVYETRGLVTM